MAKGRIITADDLLLQKAGQPGRPEMPAAPLTLDEAMRSHILSVLDSQGWNITHTARVLDISPTTLRKKIADYQLKRA